RTETLGNRTWDPVSGASLDQADRPDLSDHDAVQHDWELHEGADAGLDDRRRTVKRYSNRKLYDTRESRYVTLLQIAEMVRAGEEGQIIENATKTALTEVTRAQNIYEEQKQHSRSVPLQTLRDLIHQRGEKLMT